MIEELATEQSVKPLQIGDYVLATKYHDGDPGDNWALGYYNGERGGRHYVLDGNGQNIRGNGFARAARIRPDVGRWLLSVAAPHLEKCPPGTVNLWTMLTDAAFDPQRVFRTEIIGQRPVGAEE